MFMPCHRACVRESGRRPPRAFPRESRQATRHGDSTPRTSRAVDALSDDLEDRSRTFFHCHVTSACRPLSALARECPGSGETGKPNRGLDLESSGARRTALALAGAPGGPSPSGPSQYIHTYLRVASRSGQGPRPRPRPSTMVSFIFLDLYRTGTGARGEPAPWVRGWLF